MGKAIKVKEETYNRLIDVQDKRESFDHEINRLLDVYTMLQDMNKTLGPGHLVHKKTANVEGS